MKTTFALVAGILFSTSFAFATSNEDAAARAYRALPSCDQAVFVSDRYLASAVPQGGGSIVHVVELAHPANDLQLPTHDPVVDVKIVGDKIYVLTATTLSIWDQTQSQVRTWSTSQATGFIISGTNAVITQGLAGFSVVDLGTGKLVRSFPMIGASRAVDIAAVDASTAVAAIDDDAEGAFHGMYLIDLNTFRITRQIKIDNVDPSAVRVLDENRLMMVYFNAIWTFDLSHALSSDDAQPQARVWQFPGVDQVDMVGKVAFGQKYLFTCMQEHGASGNLLRRVPMAIELSSIGL